MNPKIITAPLFIRFALGLAPLLQVHADTAPSVQANDVPPIEKAAIESERGREAALASRDGHAKGTFTFTLPGAEDETDGSTDVQVNVVVDMTDEGRKVAPPTPENPAYYVSLPMGNKEYGYAPFFQKNPPTPGEVKILLSRELSKNGYLLASRAHDPSLVLTYFWGYLSQGDGVPPQVTAEIAASLLRGNPYATNYNKVAPDHRMDGRQEMYRMVWYVLVSAFDARDWVRHKQTMLWCAHIYTPAFGHYLDQVLPTLITTAGPMLGHETARPETISATVGPPGRVIVGVPIVEDYPSPPDAQASAAK